MKNCFRKSCYSRHECRGTSRETDLKKWFFQLQVFLERRHGGTSWTQRYGASIYRSHVAVICTGSNFYSKLKKSISLIPAYMAHFGSMRAHDRKVDIKFHRSLEGWPTLIPHSTVRHHTTTLLVWNNITISPTFQNNGDLYLQRAYRALFFNLVWVWTREAINSSSSSSVIFIDHVYTY